MSLLALTLAGCGSGPDASSAAPTAMATPQITAATTAAPSTTSASALSVSAGPTPSSPTPSSAARKAASPPAPAGGFRYVFPVNASNVAWHQTHSKYPATDIFADCGKPVVAATSGRILEVSRTDTYVKGRPDGPTNGGLSVSLLGDDGVRYYGSHLSAIQSGIAAGVRVRAGQQLGLLGRTGNANGVCHLHFGISPKCAGTGDWKVRRGVVWPYSYVASWRKKGSKSPVSAVAAWEKAHRCNA
jgi:murein DD-endopeptidase MepM/ murein hydrolase activator NlpD